MCSYDNIIQLIVTSQNLITGNANSNLIINDKAVQPIPKTHQISNIKYYIFMIS